MTSSGIVAENSSVCRAAQSGSDPTIRRTSGQKPMSIIRSASSSTSVSSLSNATAPLRMVIHQPAGRRDDDVDAGLQRALLRIHRYAAVDRDARQVRVIREALDIVLDLTRQLAGRREDQHAREPALLRRRLARAEHPIQNRQEEGCRFAGARIGAPNEVVAVHHDGDDGALDRCRDGEAADPDALDERGAQAQRLERYRAGVVLRLDPRDVRARRGMRPHIAVRVAGAGTSTRAPAT